MPIYTYRCDSCGRMLETRQSFSDDPLTTCEQCQGPLRRILHPVGIVFKGSGFYNTDYRSSSSRGGGGSSDGAAKKDDASASKTGDGAAASASSTTKGDASD